MRDAARTSELVHRYCSSMRSRRMHSEARWRELLAGQHARPTALRASRAAFSMIRQSWRQRTQKHVDTEASSMNSAPVTSSSQLNTPVAATAASSSIDTKVAAADLPFSSACAPPKVSAHTMKRKRSLTAMSFSETIILMSS